jgi:phytoene/squalene synthetase
LDEEGLEKSERLAIVRREIALMDQCYGVEGGNPPHHLSEEEYMLVELIRSDTEKDSGLQLYIRNMMAVMAFDAERMGRMISAQELADYSRWLSVAVTEALHFYIGHRNRSPHNEMRYLAVTAAHITHMLRDTVEDNRAGYFNIPREILEAHNIKPWDIKSDAYRDYVKSRVELARDYFRVGREYLAGVENLRCRLAGYSYIARFTPVLDAIERDGYLLRPTY